MKKILFLFLVNLASFNAFAGVADILHDNPWDVLRYKFETHPNKLANSWSKLLVKGGTAAGVGTLSYFLGKVMHQYYYNHSPKLWTPYGKGTGFIQATASNLLLPMSLTSAVIAYKITHNIFVREIQAKQLKNFLENWKEYKPYVPSSLSDKLSKVHEVYLKNKTEFEEQVDEVIDVIVSEVNLHFYGDPKGKSFFDAKFFHTFMIVDIARIIESCIKGYKAYNG